MIATLRSEWIKFRTVRMNGVLTIIAVAFPLVIVGLTALLIDADDMDGGDLASLVSGTSIITGMLLGVMAAAGITSEFGFNTIRPTFAATPRRMRVISAKAVLSIAVGAAVGAAVVVVSFALGATLLNGRDGDVSLPAGDARMGMVGVVVFAAIVSLLGLGLGMLIRSTPAAVAVLILWPLVAEGLVAGILFAAGIEDAGKWLPYQSGLALSNTDSSAASDTLGRWTGGAYFLAVTVAVGAFGAWSVSTRDA
ncbi:MAG: hypothetical protein KDB40_24000 [Acidimicrobiales bacterium]|nr:hypothetical protein [Acidimicrobiales bacterium]MCB9395825.1 hypothetical protein [Acidimicrobiaceae bacterium]